MGTLQNQPKNQKQKNKKVIPIITSENAHLQTPKIQNFKLP